MGTEEVAHQKAINAWFGNNGNEELEASFNDGWFLCETLDDKNPGPQVSKDFLAGWEAKKEYLKLKAKPTLKDLDDFNPDTSTGRVLDFASKKKEVEDQEEEKRSKFDITHGPYTLYFKMRSCGGGVHCYYVQKQTGEHPEMGTFEAFIQLDDMHIELNAFEEFFNDYFFFIKFKFTLHKKIEKEVTKWRNQMLKDMDNAKKTQELSDNFHKDFGGKIH